MPAKHRGESIVSSQLAAPAAVAASQAVAAGGYVVLNGPLVSTLVVLGVPFLAANMLNSQGYAQPLTITSAGNDTGITFTISGTDYAGTPISEVLAGKNAQAATSLYLYRTVTSIKASGATASTITAGTSYTQYGAWLIMGTQQRFHQTLLVAFINVVSTFSIQATGDIQLMNQVGGYADDITTLVSGAQANFAQNFSQPWCAYRLLVSAGGPVTLRLLDSNTV